MANVTYDILWREAMMELLDQLEAENPEDPMLAPKDLAEWSCIYIKYLQIFRKLETSYNQMVHPQKRLDMKRALEACCGRILEVRHWLVKLNRGLDFVNLDDILVDLKLTPDVLEVAIPRYFREDRAKELEDRGKFLEALVEKYSVPRHKDAESISSQAAFHEEDAIAMLQLNERGRQARAKARMMDSIKKQRQLEDKRSRSGIPLTSEDATLKIQKVARGYISRQRLAAAVREELEFLKMRPVTTDPKKDPNSRVEQVMGQRKVVQRENQAEYDEAIVVLKQKVKEQEGQDMRETIQDKINAWFVETRDSTKGTYAEFPEKEEGGSRGILNPEPPEPPALESEEDKKGGGKGKGGKGKEEKKGGKGKGKGKEKAEADGEAKEEVVTSIFVPDIETSVQEYVVKWQDRDESTNFFQKYDAELVKDELRPIVFEEIRLQVDDEMRILLKNLVDMVEAERAAKSGKKGKGKGKKKKGKGKGKKGKGKGKKGKDPTADRSMESLYAELVSNGILQQCPARHVLDYAGSFSFLGSILEKSNILPDPSMGQVRQAITEYCILPLGSQYIHEKVPLIKSVLLYGMPRTGKTLLSHAVANLAGANFFNLSPRNTDGKYPGKAAALMIHMVFKVARTMAPSVIYIDEAEKVFVSDKKKKKEFQPYSEAFDRIKKLILKEVKKMAPGERVLLIGNSAAPQLCMKKDRKAFLNFWNKHLYVPVPDYASLRILWPALCSRHGGTLNYEFDLSTLCSISENYTSGAIDLVTSSMMTARRKEMLKKRPLTVKEVLQWLSKVKPISPEEDGAVRKWTNDLPVRAAILGGGAKRPKSAKKGGKGKKGKK